MKKIVAYCGLVCSGCPAFVATRSGSCAELERVAKSWRKHFTNQDITAESIACDGCTGKQGGRLSGYGATCAVRKCGLARGIENCAHCSEYPCAELGSFHAHAWRAKSTLEKIRSTLSRGR